MYNKNFEFSVSKLLGIEKGFVDNKNDSGRKTNWGITEKTARAYGYKGDMKELPIKLAKEIYYKEFWLKMKCDFIPDADIAFELFERYVNTGLKRTPIRILQRSINVFNYDGKLCSDVIVDGCLGTKTSKALTKILSKNDKIKSRILKALNCFQAVRYFELAEKRKKDEDFVGGWFDHRIQL